MSSYSIIERVVSYYRDDEGDVEKAGEGFKICCPFHGEKSPSCWIQPEKEMFYCFGCGESGSAIDYIILKEEWDTWSHDTSQEEKKKLNSVAFGKAKNQLSKILESESSQIDELLSKRQKVVESKPISPLDRNVVMDFTKDKSNYPSVYRGIREETFRYFGHLFKLDKDGNVLAEWYPETFSYKTSKGEQVNPLGGYKCRNFPKDFTRGKIGTTGSRMNFSGQHKCKGTRHSLLIVGGELDKCAAHQMFVDRMKERDEDYESTHVVSITAGENSIKSQIEHNLDFVLSYKNVYIGLDNDAAGVKATNLALEALPSEFRQNVKIVTWSGDKVKDPNDLLRQGKQKQFMSDFYNAKPYVPDGIKSSVDASLGVRDYLLRPRIPLPNWFPRKAKKMLRDHLPLGVIVNIVADTSIGKTTFVRQLNDFWLFNSPYKVGVVSLEEVAEQYYLNMLCYRIRKDITNFDTETTLSLWDSPDVQQADENLRVDEEGKPRFEIIDDRDGTVSGIIHQCEILIRQYGCKLIIIDPIQDLTDGMSLEEQQKLVKWEKQIVKEGVTIVNVCHVRKNVGGATLDKDGKRKIRRITGDDIQGTSTISKSGAVTIILERDKHHEDDVEKNKTYMILDKNRHGKQTGDAGSMYYNGIQLVDYDEWTENQFNSTHPTEKKEESFEENVVISEKHDIIVESNDEGSNEAPFDTTTNTVNVSLETVVDEDEDCIFNV